MALPVFAVGEAANGTSAEPAPSGAITVGQFLIEMARILDPELPTDLSLELAVESLAATGLAVPEDMEHEATLTEGGVVRFASAVGVRLKSLDPTGLFPAEKVEPLGLLLRDGLSGNTGTVAAVLNQEGDPNLGEGTERARENRKKKKEFESPHGNR
jgi:hypothetical protein